MARFQEHEVMLNEKTSMISQKIKLFSILKNLPRLGQIIRKYLIQKKRQLARSVDKWEATTQPDGVGHNFGQRIIFDELWFVDFSKI